GNTDVARKGQRNTQLTAENWIQALKRGRTFFTSGPLLAFQVNDALPGDSLKLPAGGADVVLKAQVWSIVPLTRAVIYQNGRGWKELSLAPDRRGASLQETTKINQSSWFSLIAEGAERSHPIDTSYPQAATSAFRVYVGSQKIRNKDSAEYFIRWIDKLQTMAAAWPGW